MADIAAEAFFGAYRLLGRALVPVLPLALSWRAARGKEDRSRMGERFGRASLPRPAGRLVWVHAASVGETNAVLPLIERLAAAGVSVILTTVTVTSATVAAERLPVQALHQFAPLDVAPVLDRFLGHWRPDLALFVESEQWPTTIAKLAAAGVPHVVVNGRLSDRSYRRWLRVARLVRPMFARTALCLAQTSRDAERYARLGVREVRVVGNLKFDVPPLDASASDVAAVRAAIGDRPVWLAASTHDGEEAAIATAHRILKVRFPDLLTIIVPRHPHRGPSLQLMLTEAGLAVARRAAGGIIGPHVEVYLADTLGELGLFYRLSPIAYLGGSLVPRGGQSPIEPARLACVMLHGPHVENFVEIYESLDRAGQAQRVADARELAEAVADFLDDPAATHRRASEAAETLRPFAGALEATMRMLAPFLEPTARTGIT
jgi:3-deoxy-D-manno-octulosonic-acid transferase